MPEVPKLLQKVQSRSSFFCVVRSWTTQFLFELGIADMEDDINETLARFVDSLLTWNKEITKPKKKERKKEKLMLVRVQQPSLVSRLDCSSCCNLRLSLTEEPTRTKKYIRDPISKKKRSRALIENFAIGHGPMVPLSLFSLQELTKKRPPIHKNIC